MQALASQPGLRAQRAVQPRQAVLRHTFEAGRRLRHHGYEAGKTRLPFGVVVSVVDVLGDVQLHPALPLAGSGPLLGRGANQRGRLSDPVARQIKGQAVSPLKTSTWHVGRCGRLSSRNMRTQRGAEGIEDKYGDEARSKCYYFNSFLRMIDRRHRPF